MYLEKPSFKNNSEIKKFPDPPPKKKIYLHLLQRKYVHWKKGK